MGKFRRGVVFQSVETYGSVITYESVTMSEVNCLALELPIAMHIALKRLLQWTCICSSPNRWLYFAVTYVLLRSTSYSLSNNLVYKVRCKMIEPPPFSRLYRNNSLNDCVANCLKSYCGYNVYLRTLLPGFSNVRYRFYSDIDRLTAVLALHKRKIAHPFDKCLLTKRTVIKEISIL